MRSFTFLAAVVLAIAVPAAAQDSITIDETGAAGYGSGAAARCGAAGCRSRQAPPWHGTVAGDDCGPSCPPPNVFHANPCGQLWMKHTARQQGYCLPPCFPRMHGLLAEGSMPTPRPISLPRCPQCGAHIEGGF